MLSEEISPFLNNGNRINKAYLQWNTFQNLASFIMDKKISVHDHLRFSWQYDTQLLQNLGTSTMNVNKPSEDSINSESMKAHLAFFPLELTW